MAVEQIRKPLAVMNRMISHCHPTHTEYNVTMLLACYEHLENSGADPSNNGLEIVLSNPLVGLAVLAAVATILLGVRFFSREV